MANLRQHGSTFASLRLSWWFTAVCKTAVPDSLIGHAATTVPNPTAPNLGRGCQDSDSSSRCLRNRTCRPSSGRTSRSLDQRRWCSQDIFLVTLYGRLCARGETKDGPKRWIERIYSERDVGRGVATLHVWRHGIDHVSALWRLGGLGICCRYRVSIARIAASSFHSHWNRTREQTRGIDKWRDLFDGLGSEEKAVVHGFVRHGGSVMTWREFNRSEISRISGSSR